jgi:glycosyltransferase involved in cell wall biosynthesis
LVRGIQEALGNPLLARQLADRARQDVAAYTWEQRAEKVMAFVQSIVGEG